MHGITKKMSTLVVCVAVMVTILAGAVQASGSVIFDDQFTSPTLGPDWAISPGRGNYSLTDNPGYLRYIIDAQHVLRDTPGYAQPLLLVRSFSGDQWILTTAVTYNMRPSWPTDNRWMVFEIRGPDGMQMVWIGRIVTGYWPHSDVMYLNAGSNVLLTEFPPSPNPLPLERWYFEIERNKDHVAIRASNDGNDSTFEYESEYTFPPGSFENDQQIEIWGAGWWGSNNPPGYGDLDFIKVVPTIIPVTIDVKPGSFPNSINPKSKGKIPVAILTTDTFDATTVDPTTVRFGATGTEAEPVQSAPEDVDGDGDTDMIFHINTQDTGIECGDTSASLTGETFDGQAIVGSDTINTVGCK